MRYVLLAIRIDVKQSGFGLSVLGFSVGVPDLGMMKINPEKGEIWFFQAVRKIRLQLRTPKLLYHLFIFDQSSKTGYGSVLPLFGTGKSYVDDAIADCLGNQRFRFFDQKPEAIKITICTKHRPAPKFSICLYCRQHTNLDRPDDLPDLFTIARFRCHIWVIARDRENGCDAFHPSFLACGSLFLRRFCAFLAQCRTCRLG
jgi:hypothetical protein